MSPNCLSLDVSSRFSTCHLPDSCLLLPHGLLVPNRRDFYSVRDKGLIEALPPHAICFRQPAAVTAYFWPVDLQQLHQQASAQAPTDTDERSYILQASKKITRVDILGLHPSFRSYR